MRLTVVLFRYFPYGGLQRDCLRFIELARARGHEVTVCCMHWEGARPPGLPIVELPARGRSNHRRILSFVQAFDEWRAGRPETLVLGFNKMPGLDVYYAADSCYEHKVRTQRPACYRWLPRYRVLAAMEKAVFSAGTDTLILTISALEQARYEAHYHTPASRMYRLPPGIDRSRCYGPLAPGRRRQLRQSLHLREEQTVLLFVGSGFIKKGLDRALLALSALHRRVDAEACGHPVLLVVGQDKSARFRALASRLGIAKAVHFLGGRQDIPDLLFAADLLLHPAYDEAAGIVLLEAIVAGLPVITTDSCGYAPHVDAAGAGKVVTSPFQQCELDEVLADAVRSKAQRERWHARALAYAEKEDLYHLHERGLDIVEQCWLSAQGAGVAPDAR